MEVLLASAIAILYAAAVYLMLDPRPLRLLLGLGLLGQGANLLIFVAAGVKTGGVPLIPKGAETLPQTSPDPLPQALILTAIVIGFGVLTFAIAMLVIARRAAELTRLDNMPERDGSG